MGPGPQEERFQKLAARIQSRDSAAEDEFFRAFQPRVRGYAMVHTRDRELAEELTQEVLWTAIRALRDGKVQHPGQLPAFVLGTARNLINDERRSRSRSRTEPLDEQAEQTIAASRNDDFERRHSACQAIAKLEPHERWVLMLSLVEGLGTDEIAARLKITSESVRKRKSRALKKLAEILRPGQDRGAPDLLSHREAPD